MYVSLNGSLTRQMPWPDFVRLAGKLGYGGVDVNLNPAKADGVEATLRSSSRATSSRRWRICRCSSRCRTKRRFRMA